MTLQAAFSGIAYPFGSAAGGVVPDVRSGMWFRDDFLNSQLGAAAALGTGSSAINNTPVAGHPGALSMQVSALNDRISWSGEGLGFAGALMQGAGALQIDFQLMIPTVSDGTNNMTFRFGLGDTFVSADQANGLYFETDWASHGNANTWFACTANGGVRTKTSMGVAPVAGAWTRFRIVQSAAGVATFTINESLSTNINTNIPAAAIAPMVNLIKQLGAALLTVQVDYYELNYAVTR